MSGELRVSAEELDQTASRQRDVSEALAAAERITDGVTRRVGFSHGVVCALSIAGLGAAQTSRAAATKAVQSVADGLAEKLGTAATEYRATDSQQHEHLQGQVPPR